MLQRKPHNRLGYNGINEIKEHPWLKYYPWKDLYQKRLESPFIPKSNDNFDKKYCQGPDKIGNDTLERYQNYYKKDALADVFNNYSFENLLTTKGNINPSQKKNYANFDNSKNQNFNSSLNSTKKKLISNSQSAQLNSNNTNNLQNKNNINQLLKSKMKITESIYLNNKISSSISTIRNTPNQNKINSANNINLLKTKNKSNFSSASLTGKQLNATPFRFFNEKSGDKLPFIDQKNSTKHISSHSMVNKKILNSPSMNHPIKALNKYSSISNNNNNNSSSLGSNNMSINFLHRRSGSTNLPNKY